MAVVCAHAYMAKRLETPGGVQRMKALLERGFAAEYRAAL
jgi:hypothetical protein